MSFLQPLLLAAIPLIGLPVLIHLVNQRRYQTMPWAAMIFLLAANRLSRGFARLRQWLILAMRTLAIAGLIFALARPLASGWLGLAAGSKADTTIILLDRSPSMSTASNGRIDTKLDTGRRHLAEALEKLGSDHWVLIDSATAKPTEIESPQDLLTAPETDPVGASANLPTMLRAAYQYMQSNQTGRTDVWICSDMRSHDWDAEGGAVAGDTPEFSRPAADGSVLSARLSRGAARQHVAENDEHSSPRNRRRGGPGRFARDNTQRQNEREDCRTAGRAD